jgi:hypothetical protein
MFNLKTAATNSEKEQHKETTDVNESILESIQVVEAFRKAREEHSENKNQQH